MKLVKIPVGAVGCDMLTPLSPHVAVALAGFTIVGTNTRPTFAIRYLENLTVSELASTMASGLGLAFVSEARIPGWMPSAAFGSADGLRVVTRARALGIPAGTQLWCDIETPAAAATHADIAAYVKAWCDVVNPTYEGVGYVGFGLPSTPQELYALPLKGYWHSLSNVQPVANVDYMMIQLFPTMTLQLPTGPLGVDWNVVQQDKRGRSPTMVVTDNWGNV